MCSTIYFIYISNRFVKNYKFFPPYIKRIEISNTVCILCLILQIKNKIVLATRILFFYCFFLFPDLHDTYKLIESCLIDSTDFENPLNYIFLWILSLVVKSHLFQFTFVLFLTGFFPVDIFDRYEMQMIQLKKKWQDNWFFCIRTLFCNVTFYWYKSLYYYILLYICKK